MKDWPGIVKNTNQITLQADSHATWETKLPGTPGTHASKVTSTSCIAHKGSRPGEEEKIIWSATKMVHKKLSSQTPQHGSSDN